MAILSCLNMNAQVMKVMKGDKVVATYNADLADRVVFEEAPTGVTHEYVDLGLSVKWATCNIGAEEPEQYGLYFTWGGTVGYDTNEHAFNWHNYSLNSGKDVLLTKYNNKDEFGIVDNKKVLEPENDAATANWGPDWRMPSVEDYEELRSQCYWNWTTRNGVRGFVVQSKVPGYTDRSIFLPAGGYRDETGRQWAGIGGYYWTNKLGSEWDFDDSPLNSRCLILWVESQTVRYYVNSSSRCLGMMIRPVCQ